MQRSIDVRPPAVPGRDAESLPIHLPQRGSEPTPMPRRKTKKSHGLATLVAVGLVVILAATIGGLYVFGPGSNRGGVAVTVEAPATATSGDEVTYTITVGNADVALDVADLTLEYPAGFLVTSVNPPADNAAGQSLFRLAPLRAGGEATVSITGRLLGAAGTAAELRARLDYEPENFSSSFHVEGAAVVRIAASRVRLTFEAPNEAVSPGQLALAVSLENVGDQTLNNVEVVLEVPEGVSVTSSTPPLASGTGELRFDVGTLERGGTWRAQATADIVGDGGSRRGLAVAVYQRIGGQRVVIERALREVEVVQPAAEVALDTGSLSDGSVPVSVQVRNAGSSTLQNLRLRLRLAGPVDWDRLATGSGQRDGEAVAWDSSSADVGSSLGSLAAEATVSVALDVPIRADALPGEAVQLVAVLTSADYGEDWQASAGPTSILAQ